MNSLIVFHADWCQPCQQYKPVVSEFEDSFEGQVERVNIDRSPRTTEAYDIKSVPTTVLENEDGDELSRLSGVKTLPELQRWVEKHV